MKNLKITCRRSVLFFSVMFATVASFAQSEFTVIPKESNLTFQATGKPSMLKIKGSGKDIEGNFQIDKATVQGTLKLPLKTLESGIDLRDRHMKEKYLEVEKYPDAILKIKDFKPKGDLAAAIGMIAPSQDFTGTLSLHGKEQPIKGTFEMANPNEIKADFEIKLTDYAIEIPSYMGITVADLVKINVTLKLEKRK